MEIVRTEDFDQSAKRLPKSIQKFIDRQLNIFQEHWRDSRLHIKKVQGLDGVFSFRITRRYRALFYFQRSDRAIVFDIDHRKDSYRRL